jgi:hypothetical protein
VHGPEPTKPHELGNAASVLAIRLDRHRLEGVPRMARLEKLHRRAGHLQTSKQPLRQRARLQPNPRKGYFEPPNQAISASGSLATFASLSILPCPSTTQTLEHSNDTSIPAE